MKMNTQGLRPEGPPDIIYILQTHCIKISLISKIFIANSIQSTIKNDFFHFIVNYLDNCYPLDQYVHFSKAHASAWSGYFARRYFLFIHIA